MEESVPTMEQVTEVEDVRRALAEKMARLPCAVKDILTIIGMIGDETGCNVYVVGGFVRDLLIGILNVDFDIVIEGT